LLKYSVDKEGIAYFSVLFIVMSQSWYVSFAPFHAFFRCCNSIKSIVFVSYPLLY
jgi:uncharacterized membrane protein